MADTVGIELLEREPSLAVLAGYAAVAGEITDQINPGTFRPIHCQGIRAAVRS